MQSSKLSSLALFGTAALAAAGFAVLNRAVARGKTVHLDLKAKRAAHGARNRGLTLAAHSTTPLGKWWGYLPPALMTAAKLRKAGRPAAARTIAGTAVVAALLPLVLERVATRRGAPPERHEPSKQSYPSGHALQSSAVALTTTYVMHRENLGSGWLAPLGPLSLATGLSRLLLDRHWASDILGGYCAGIALAATSSGLYELSRAGSQ